MNIFFYLIFFIIFFVLSYRYFRLGLGLLIILFPTYLIRLSIGDFPTTLLEISFTAVFLVWLIKYFRKDVGVLKRFIIEHRILFLFLFIFLFSSIISIFVSGEYMSAFGIWRAYFLQPILFFIILISSVNRISRKDLILFLCLSTLSIVFYSVFQSFTGIGISTPEWSAAATRRVTAFFSSPNSVGLYIAPIITLIIYFIISKKNNGQGKMLNILYNRYLWFALLIVSLATLFFTKSQGAWVGLFIGMIVFMFMLGYKKISVGILVVTACLAILIPSARSALLFQDLASQNRLLLWNQSWSYLSSSPTNFVFGTGIRQFYNKVQKPTHDWKRIERHIYPHNIFLNFWTEIGIFGMVSFIGILSYLFLMAFRITRSRSILGPVFIAMLTIILVHGLVDVPYFKNDLSFMFWTISALVLISCPVSKNDVYEI